MRIVLPRFSALRSATAGLSCALAGLLAVGAGAADVIPRAPEPSSAPVAAPSSKASKPRPKPSPSPRPARPRPEPVARDRLAIFRGLGAWIDLYDFEELPIIPTIDLMRRNGVRTIYLQTARSNTDYAVHPRSGRWLVEAHRAGIEVVGWYLPYYKNMERDLRRTMAIKRYHYRGHRFDGAGIDIEYRAAVHDRARWMRRVAVHAQRARRALGARYPLAAIPPPPLQMRVAPGFWQGFPWRSLAGSTDAMLLMSYWSDRIGCPKVRRHCAYDYTRRNVELTRELTGRPKLLVHIIGGVGDAITSRQLRAFVRGARTGGADGASIYDVVTTKPSWWRALRRLKDLR